MTGSIVDHAIALTSYLTCLEVQAWLLLGYGLPYGNSAYVLVREYTSKLLFPMHHIYDVVTGLKYDVMDNFSPLQKVYCVINGTNVSIKFISL